MRPHFDDQVEVARQSPHRTCVAFPWDANASAGRHACRNSHVDGFRATHAAFAATILARSAKFSSAAAARAWHVEAHFAGGLLNGSRPIACWTGLWRTDRARAVAGFAGVHARDLQFFYAAAHCVPKVNFEFVFERAAGFGFFFNARAAASTKELAEEIAKTRAAAGCSAAAEIEPIEIKVDVAVAACRGVVAGRSVLTVKAILVIHLALF